MSLIPDPLTLAYVVFLAFSFCDLLCVYVRFCHPFQGFGGVPQREELLLCRAFPCFSKMECAKPCWSKPPCSKLRPRPGLTPPLWDLSETPPLTRIPRRNLLQRGLLQRGAQCRKKARVGGSGIFSPTTPLTAPLAVPLRTCRIQEVCRGFGSGSGTTSSVY